MESIWTYMQTFSIMLVLRRSRQPDKNRDRDRWWTFPSSWSLYLRLQLARDLLPLRKMDRLCSPSRLERRRPLRADSLRDPGRLDCPPEAAEWGGLDREDGLARDRHGCDDPRAHQDSAGAGLREEGATSLQAHAGRTQPGQGLWTCGDWAV